MGKPTQVIVYGNSLNMAGLAASLRTHMGLDVVCVNPQSPTARQRLNEVRPRAIAFDLRDPLPGLDITLLRERPGLLLIGVDPCSDELLVLSCHPQRVLSVADLVKAICQKGSNPGPFKGGRYDENHRSA